MSTESPKGPPGGVEYCQAMVTDAVSDGLIALVKSQPADPIDFLGNFMLHYSKSLVSSRAATEAQLAAKALAEAEAEAAAAAALAAESSPETLAAKKLVDTQARIKGELENCPEVTPEVLTSVLDALKELVGATGAYVSERLGEPAAEGEEGGKSLIRYIAASLGAEEVLECKVPEGKGVMWDAWVLPPAPEVEEVEPEEGEPVKPPPPPPELPVVHIKNALKDKKVVFHGIPRPGAFLVQPLQYGTPFHAGAVPPPADPAEAAAAKEAELALEAPPAEGEEDTPEAAAAREAARAARVAREEAELATGPQAPTPLSQPRNLAICVDTLGQNRDFTPAQKDTVKLVSGWLKDALLRTEIAQYSKEYLSGSIKQKTTEEEETLMAEDRAAAEAVIKAGEEAAAALGETAAEDLKTLAKSSAALSSARSSLESRVSAFEELAERRVPPREPTLKIIECVCLILGKTREELGDATGLDPNALFWPRVRVLLQRPLLEAMLGGYDPAALPPPAAKPTLAYQRIEALRALLEGLPPSEEIAAKEGPLISTLASWARAALDVKEASVAKRKREKEEEEAAEAAKKEAEEAAKAAAEEAAAEEGGGGGEEATE